MSKDIFYFLIFVIMNEIDSEDKYPLITYPGITVENIPGTKSIYEIVFNCGGLSVTINALSEEKTRNDATKYLIYLFEKIREKSEQIIIITDGNIINNTKQLIENILKNIFGKGNYALIGTKVILREKNSISGLNVNRTGFESEKLLLETIRQMPNATVLSSVPMSDPRITDINFELEKENLKSTTAGKTLQLLDLNSKKSNQLEIAGEKMGYIGIANNKEELENIFNQNPGKVLVIKDDDGAAGGTTVNFVQNDLKRKNLLNSSELKYPQLVFNFIEPTKIIGADGRLHVTQFRPWLDRNEFLGGAFKFARDAIPTFTENGAGKSDSAKMNKGLNSSSGQTHSIILNQYGDPIVGYFSDNKGKYDILDGEKTAEVLSKHYFENGKKVSGNEIIILCSIVFDEVKKIQEKVNQNLGTLKINY
ncbi:hypothetical protein BKN14_02510 [Candidatus Gracilibacteria bacterium HOT-871]|nr:hypothetical protein BKN14_02510 [Candidatus Gracilibacteria bacterium HOT-871]